MARQEKQSRVQKSKLDTHQRNLRRNQIILVVLSGLLIISLVLSQLLNF